MGVGKLDSMEKWFDRTEINRAIALGKIKKLSGEKSALFLYDPIAGLPVLMSIKEYEILQDYHVL